MAEIKDTKINGDLEVTGSVTASGITATGLSGLTATVAELNYMDGVTGNVQTQLNGKSASSHTHSEYAASNHTHSGYAASSHTHDKIESSTSDYNRLMVRGYTGTPTLSDGTNYIYLQEDWDNNCVNVGINGKGGIGVNSARTLSTTLPVNKGGTGATTLTSGAVLLGNGTGAVTTRAIQNNTSTSAVTVNNSLITGNTLAMWNGRYGTGTESKLAYCNKGAFGDMATKTASNYSLSTHTHTLSSLGLKFTSIVTSGSAATSASWTNGAYDFIIGTVRPASSNTPACFSMHCAHGGTELQITDEVQCTVWTTSATGMSRKSGSGTIFGLYGVNVV